MDGTVCVGRRDSDTQAGSRGRMGMFLGQYLQRDQRLAQEMSEQTRLAGSVIQLCLTLCDPLDCSLPGFSVHAILQARILE